MAGLLVAVTTTRSTTTTPCFIEMGIIHHKTEKIYEEHSGIFYKNGRIFESVTAKIQRDHDFTKHAVQTNIRVSYPNYWGSIRDSM